RVGVALFHYRGANESRAVELSDALGRGSAGYLRVDDDGRGYVRRRWTGRDEKIWDFAIRRVGDGVDLFVGVDETNAVALVHKDYFRPESLRGDAGAAAAGIIRVLRGSAGTVVTERERGEGREAHGPEGENEGAHGPEATKA